MNKNTGLIVLWLAFLSVSAIGFGAIMLSHIPKYIFGIELFFLLVISILFLGISMTMKKVAKEAS